MLYYIVIIHVLANSVGPGTHADHAAIIGPVPEAYCKATTMFSNDWVVQGCGTLDWANGQLGVWDCLELAEIAPDNNMVTLRYTCGNPE